MGRSSAIRGSLLLCVLSLVPAGPAHAQTSYHVSSDNDYFNFWIAPDERTDLNYAHGAELAIHGSYLPRAVARLVPTRWRAPSAGPLRSVVRVRQEIYLPSSRFDDRPGDRPFAGWLEIAAGIRQENALRLRYALVHVGVTGPPSFGEKIQTWVHHAFRFGERSWAHEVPYEPAVTLEAGGSSLVASQGGENDLLLIVGPAWRARLGTAFVDATAGLHAAAGLRPSPPWRAAETPAVTGLSLYAIGAARVDLVAHRVFLDGTVFRDSPGVEKRAFVPEVEVGLGARFGNVRAEWRTVHRAREFERQVATHAYSILTLSVVPGTPR